MKKIIKLIFILLFVLILAVGVCFVLTIDKSDINNPDVLNSDKESIEVINNELYEGTKDVKTTSKANVLFSEVELESLVYPILKGIKIQNPSFEFTGVNFDVKNSEYSIMVSCSALGFYKTVAKLKIEFKNENDSFIIKFDEVKLGKLGLTGIGKLIVGFVNEEKLVKSLEDSGIYASVDLNKLMVSMSYSQIESTLSDKMEDGTSDLASLLIDIFLKNNDILKFNFGEDDLLGVKLNLENTKYDNTKHGELTYSYDFTDISNKCKSLLNEKKISVNELDPTFNYLVRGYDFIEEETQNKIVNIDYSSIGITNNRTYEGIIDRSDLSLQGYIGGLFVGKTALEILPMMTGGLMISDDFLNGIFQSQKFVGFSYAFNNYNNDVGYLVIESLALTCIDQRIKIDLIANINGLRMCIEIDADALDDSAEGLVINCGVRSILIGSIDLTDDEKTKLMKFLEGVFEEIDWIGVNVEKNELQLDFSKVMSDAISSNPTVSGVFESIINYKGNVYVEDGYVSIKYSAI